jgi:hypothetical protein
LDPTKYIVITYRQWTETFSTISKKYGEYKCL